MPFPYITGVAKKEKEPQPEVNVGSGRYDGNTIPDSLLVEDDDSYERYGKNIGILKRVLLEEFKMDLRASDLDAFFEKARTHKYSKECIAFNKALSLIKKSFNIKISDMLISLNETVLSLEYKAFLRTIDFANRKTIEAELKENHAVMEEDEDGD
jgi:hypothetical protein